VAQRVFIDGESGTTGLRIFARLAGHPEVEMLRLDERHRKDVGARREALNACDLAVLCLPDDAAVEAVGLIENERVRVLDASCAYRVAPDWTYGFPELTAGHAERIARARFVSNPGCYASGAVALLRPLVEAGVLPPSYPVVLHAVSGYSGGGKGLIAAFEDPDAPGHISESFYEYGLSFEHKHVPEIRAHGMLEQPPLFIPSVGRFRQGMLVNLPLQLWSVAPQVSGPELEEIYRRHYAGSELVRVRPLHELSGRSAERIDPDALVDTDFLDIHLYANPRTRQALAVAQLDNLGKGACGVALQNIELMLGVTGLVSRPALAV
jgi:N-acetyl-gamma-glutamyl-phosphate reductase